MGEIEGSVFGVLRSLDAQIATMRSALASQEELRAGLDERYLESGDEALLGQQADADKRIDKLRLTINEALSLRQRLSELQGNP